MGNPVLVEVTRGLLVESSHQGSVAVVDADGRSVLALGDVARPVFPRSAVKALQALVLVESGAADRYGFAQEELALACASHGGEPAHVATATRMLARAGLAPTVLECGVHWPMHQASAQDLARGGATPSALHNNCSGKHSGFLCAACAMGVDHRAYVRSEHPVQRAVKATIESLTGGGLSEDRCAVDGCSVPTWAIPLADLALAFARFGTGHRLAPERAKAAARLRAACMAHPWHVAGTGRFCTDVMQQLGARAFVKTGAEGVYCAALPEEGLGLAVKCDDGATRAAEVMTAALIARFLKSSDGALERFVRPTLRNWNGITVGQLRPTSALLLNALYVAATSASLNALRTWGPCRRE
jgi:L-asparaginase II